MNHAELRYADYCRLRVHVDAGMLMKFLESSSNFSSKLQRGVLKAGDALDLRTTMIKVLEDIKFWKGEPMSLVANRLSKLADKYGMSVRGVCKFPDLLEEVDLEKNDIDDHVIAEAEAKDRIFMAKIQQRVAALNAKIIERERKALGLCDSPKTTAREEGVAPVSKGKPKEDGKRKKIYGYPATSVIRWMGKEGFSYEEAAKVLKHFGCDTAKNTVKIQLVAGKRGERGDPADLTLTQERELHKISGI